MLIHLTNNDYRSCTSMLDTGADLSICSFSYLKDLFPYFDDDEWDDMIQPTNISLKSYTGHKIPLLGTIDFKVKFDYKDKPQIIKLYIVKFQDRFQCKHPVILSLTDFLNLNLIIKSLKADNYMQPIVYKSNDLEQEIPSYFDTDENLNLAHAFLNDFKPKEITEIYFQLSPASKFLENDHVIISQDHIPYSQHYNIKIFPSTSFVQRYRNKMSVIAKVQNVGPTTYNGAIQGYVDFIEQSQELTVINHISINSYIENKINLLHEVSFLDSSITPIGEITLLKNIDDKIKTANIDQNIFNLDFNFAEDFIGNPDAINNDVKDPKYSLSEERDRVEESPITLTKEQEDSFLDDNETIQLGFKPNTKDIVPEDLQPSGFSIPSNYYENASDIILENNYDAEHWPYIKDIFIDKYPQIISLHSLDAGKISDTLGFYKITLKPHVSLPKTRKCYYLAPMELAQLREILRILEKLGIVSKASTSGSELSQFASPCFLIAKSNKAQTARLVVNYKLLNELITIEPPLIPTVSSILNKLRDASFYSVIDLKNAFNSISIHPDCRKYTQFATQIGAYQMNSLCTGLASSPSILARFTDMIINHVPSRDKNNTIIFDDNGYPLMLPDYLDFCDTYYDDIVVFTPAKDTYEESVKFHFQCIEKLVSRLAFHKCKISIEKASFCKSKINILGWYVCNNFIQADPKRVEKVLQAPMPKSKECLQSYLGMLNSFRTVCGFDVFKDIKHITALTSDKTKFIMKDSHKKVILDLNKTLSSAPLYSKIVQPGVPKILMTDAASASGSQYSCVLAQIIPAKFPKLKVPEYINMDDKTHRIIYDLKLPYKPIFYPRADQSHKAFMADLKTSQPPKHEYLLDKTLGYGEDVKNSFSHSLKLLLKVSNCPTEFNTICKKMVTYIRDHILHPQILENTYMSNRHMMKDFIKNMENGEISIDKDLNVFDALARVLYKSVIIINSTDKFNNQKQIIFNAPKLKSAAPLIFLLYESKDTLIVRPAINISYPEYQLSKHRGTFEIICYHTKSIPETVESNAIYTLELNALLDALHATEHLRGFDPTLALCDNKTVLWMYNEGVTKSCRKMKRWGLIIKHDHKTVTLAFLSSKNNPADYLSRKFQVPKHERVKIQLPLYVKDSLDDNMPAEEMSIGDWAKWVVQHPQFVEYKDPKPEKSLSVNNITAYSIPEVHINLLSQISREKFEKDFKETKLSKKVLGSSLSYNKIIENLTSIFQPLKDLEKILTTQRIIDEQKLEYKDIYIQALTEDTYVHNNNKYKIKNALLYYIDKDDIPKLYIPSKLLYAYIASAHLATNHSGKDKMILNLQNYFHPRLKEYVDKFTKTCYACQLVNQYSKNEKLGFYPISDQAGEILHMDLIESLPSSSGFVHILIVKCPATNFINCFPVVNKTSEEFLHIFQNYIFQFWHPKSILADNAPFFVSKKTISTLAFLKCRMFYSSAFSGFSHGGIERYVGLFKTYFKKVLAISPSFNWSFLCCSVSLLHNTSKIHKTGYSPAELIFGPGVHLSENPLLSDNLPKIHPNAHIHIDQIKEKHNFLQKIWKEAQLKIEKVNVDRTTYKNKNRITRDYKIGDIVFVKDQSKILGNTRPLKTTYYQTPFVIVQLPEKAVVVKAISNLNNKQLRRNRNEIKKYIPSDPLFDPLPPSVKNICLKQYEDINKEELDNLLSSDNIVLEEIFNTPEEIIDDEIAIVKELENGVVPIEPVDLPEDHNDEDKQIVTRSALKKAQNQNKKVNFNSKVDIKIFDS